jgi:hypothetical protein
MERLSRDPPATINTDKPLFETDNYRIDIVNVNLDNAVSPLMLRKYAVTHKQHLVVAGMGEQFAGMVEVCRQLQDAHDDALAGNRPSEKIPGSIPRPPRGGHTGGLAN